MEVFLANFFWGIFVPFIKDSGGRQEMRCSEAPRLDSNWDVAVHGLSFNPSVTWAAIVIVDICNFFFHLLQLQDVTETIYQLQRTMADSCGSWTFI